MHNRSNRNEVYVTVVFDKHSAGSTHPLTGHAHTHTHATSSCSLCSSSAFSFFHIKERGSGRRHEAQPPRLHTHAASPPRRWENGSVSRGRRGSRGKPPPCWQEAARYTHRNAPETQRSQESSRIREFWENLHTRTHTRNSRTHNSIHTSPSDTKNQEC